MLYLALAFLAGVCALHALPSLPPAGGWWLLVMLPVGLIPWRVLRAGSATVAGFLYCWWCASELLSLSLPAQLEGRDLLVQGVVEDLPERHPSGRLRFRFQVERYRSAAGWRTLSLATRLSWYQQPPALRPGERWQLLVRLKQPRGFANPGAFDYARWLFAAGIRATGYVRGGGQSLRLREAADHWLARWRYELSGRIAASASGEQAGLLAALGVGDRSGMSAAHWEVLRATGTGHLMAISGLHVGMVAALAFALVRRCWSRWGRPLLCPAPAAAALGAMAAATLYALLAGFQVPAQRALVMVWVGMLSLLWSGRPQPWRVWAAALWIVLLWDPLAVLTAGFWLSFGAVAWILYLATGRAGRLSGPAAMVGLQLALSLGLMPLLWLWFQQVSLVAPIANLVAIPWIGFLVVPLVLAAIAVLPALPWLGEPLVWLAGQVLRLLWIFLERLAALPEVLWPLAAVPASLMVLFVFGLLLLLAPRAVPVRCLGLLLMAPAVLHPPQRPGAGEVWLTLLDVGQGLAAVIETRAHVLVYDAGAAFPDGLDSGEAVVVPYLQGRGYSQVDRLVISHSDNDHLGGGEAVFRRLDVQRVQSGEPEAIGWARSRLCRAGERWQWDGVVFEYLAPFQRREGNDASCVLRIEAGDGRAILLPGDIEATVEAELVAAQAQRLASDVLVAPHHGSRTSSRLEFVRAVKPAYVLFAVGYRNRFGFPKDDVVGRYLAAGAAVMDTAASGAIEVRVVPGTPLSVRAYRAARPRYWW